MIRLFGLLWTALLIPILLASGTSPAAPPPRDNELDQLRAIRLPHIFSPAEISLINNQLDILKLGISLFLAQEQQLSPSDQQMAFSNAWPLLRCLFDGDFEAPCKAPIMPNQGPPLAQSPPQPQ